MPGDGRSRHCDLCERTVHDLSALTAAEAADVVSGAACGRVRRDWQGRVITADAAPPTGPQRAAMGAALAVLLAVSTVAADRLADAVRVVAPTWTGGEDVFVTMGEPMMIDVDALDSAAADPPRP